MSNTQSPTAFTPIPLQFTGTAWEYFRIWLVNLLLTIITLGIYSAWAKVRTTQYFYGNTQLDGSPFEYDASPMAILKGRLMAIAALFGYSIITSAVPMTAPIFWIAFLVLLPWLMARSLAFRNHFSQYRNVRFRFTGRYIESAWIFVLMPILTVLSLGLLTPSLAYRRRRFYIERSAYGTATFSYTATLGMFYRVFLEAVLLTLGILLLMAVSGYFLLHENIEAIQLAIQSPDDESSQMAGFLLVQSLFFFYISLFLVGMWVYAFIQAELTNLFWNHARLGQHRFVCDLGAGALFVILVTNALAISVSFGLLIPWTQIRLARYRARHFTMLAAEPLDQFAAATQQKVNALGEELDDVFDLDMAPGI